MPPRYVLGMHMHIGFAPTRDRGVLAIALFKFVKAIVLIAAGLGALQLVNPDVRDRMLHALSTLSLPAGRTLIERLVASVQHATSRRLDVIGIASMLYGGLFGVEGAGLWRAHHWAEWLTVVTTSLLLPLEIYELTHGVTAMKVVALVANIAIVIYLVIRLRTKEKG